MGFDSGSMVALATGEADSLQANGRVVAPGIGAAIATLAAPPAGIYEITVSVAVGTGAVALDNGNIELRFGAAVIGPVIGILSTIRKTLDGATAVTCNAIAAGTALVPYTASIVATRIG